MDKNRYAAPAAPAPIAADDLFAIGDKVTKADLQGGRVVSMGQAIWTIVRTSRNYTGEMVYHVSKTGTGRGGYGYPAKDLAPAA